MEFSPGPEGSPVSSLELSWVSKTHQESITRDLKQVWSTSPVESRGVTHHHLKVSWSSFLDITAEISSAHFLFLILKQSGDC